MFEVTPDLLRALARQALNTGNLELEPGMAPHMHLCIPHNSPM